MGDRLAWDGGQVGTGWETGWHAGSMAGKLAGRQHRQSGGPISHSILLSSLAFLWTIEGSVAAFGAAIAGKLVAVTSPQTVMVIAATFAVLSPLAYVFGSRGVLRPALASPSDFTTTSA